MSSQPYFATYVQDLEQDPFDATDFVERLAWRMTGGKDEIDAVQLKNKFEEEIGSLQLLSEQFQGKINVLEQQRSQEKQFYLDSLQQLHNHNSEALEKLKQLDGTMQTISARVVHLGDQLESVHAPRARAFEALQLMKHFDEFLADQPLNSPIFTDPDRLLESAEMIQKLASISQELDKDKFASVQIRITHKYQEIERLLIDEFIKCHDKKKMKEIAKILSEFKGYSHCLDAFVDQLQNGAFRSGNVFEDILTLCEKANPLLEEIFPNPQQVMAKLILNVFHGKLQETVTARLKEMENDKEAYLNNLFDLYSRTVRLQNSLQKFKCDSDPHFLPTLTRSIFGPYLATYMRVEQQFINEQCSSILNRYYESKGHQKRNIGGTLQEIKRDLQARLLTVENYGGETYLSEEVAINILQETKNAFARCNLLCKKSDAIKMTETLFDLLLHHLYKEHVEYAIELALAGISLAEPKSEPHSNFFPIVQQSTTITHLFIKQYEDSIHPLTKDTVIEDLISKKKDLTLRNVEAQVNKGLERQIGAIIGFIRFILNTEQKKTDFRPEDDKAQSIMTKACGIVVKYIGRQGDRIRDCIDGGNLIAVLTELGDKLYITLTTHFKSFTYNEIGAYSIIMDMDEYKKCVANWKIPSLAKKFEILHALAKLIGADAKNLNEVCSSMPLADIDRNLVNSFIQLRQDYKSAKLNFILF